MTGYLRQLVRVFVEDILPTYSRYQTIAKVICKLEISQPLTIRLDAALWSINAQGRAVTAQTQANEALEHELATLKAEVTAAKGLQRENRRLTRRIKALEKERAAYDKKMLKLESAADINSELATENKALKVQVHTLEKEIEALNTRFEDILRMAADDLKKSAQHNASHH